jgi:Ser-tRNA(Ala) deacylase AlaX
VVGPSAPAVYILDPYRVRAELDVLSCERLQPDEAEEPRFAVRVRDSIFYPTGGGQPHDTGYFGDVPVLDVRSDTEGAIHVTSAAVAPGPTAAEVDWGRRFDHMQQHTGQHLLTAVAQDRLGWATTSFHLGERECAIDLDTPSINEEQLGELERAVNAEIRQARLVRSRQIPRDQLERAGVRTRGVPDGVAGPLRVVEIDGIDLNTCGGTHVANLAELQVLKVLKVSKMHGHARLHFIVGGRVEARLAGALRREDALSRLLSAGPLEHEGLISRMLDDAKQARKREQRLVGELADAVAGGLVAADGSVVAFHDEAADMAFLQRVAGVVQRLDPTRLALLTAGGSDGDGVFLVVGPAALVPELGPAAAEAMAGRGGGRGGRFQGKADVGRRDEALDRLTEWVTKSSG